LHPTHGERFDVLAGKLTLQLGEEIVTGGPGTWAFAPPDIPPERSAAEQETRVLGSPLTARPDQRPRPDRTELPSLSDRVSMAATATGACN
jgi:quercetin dioxygenase-like cupin family protein